MTLEAMRAAAMVMTIREYLGEQKWKAISLFSTHLLIPATNLHFVA